MLSVSPDAPGTRDARTNSFRRPDSESLVYQPLCMYVLHLANCRPGSAPVVRHRREEHPSLQQVVAAFPNSGK